MLAKELAELPIKSPNAIVTVSISSNNEDHIFAEKIIEVTNQGKNITIVMDVNSK